MQAVRPLKCVLPVLLVESGQVHRAGGLLQAYRFIADSRDTAAERLDFLVDDVYRPYRSRTMRNCTVVCPKGLSSSHAIERIRLALLRRSA